MARRKAVPAIRMGTTNVERETLQAGRFCRVRERRGLYMIHAYEMNMTSGNDWYELYGPYSPDTKRPKGDACYCNVRSSLVHSIETDRQLARRTGGKKNA